MVIISYAIKAKVGDKPDSVYVVIYLRMAVANHYLASYPKKARRAYFFFLDLHRVGFSEPKDRSLAGKLLPPLFTFACEL